MQELNLAEMEEVGGALNWAAVGVGAMKGALLGTMRAGVPGLVMGALVGGGMEAFAQTYAPESSIAGQVGAL
ncbi:hypothetical protein [Undibacterium luofuense]|uniref:hypothetical protein n=1 Tax=Undibacterium luofuense TaxID=2828733 RepID=UPI0030EBBF1F